MAPLSMLVWQAGSLDELCLPFYSNTSHYIKAEQDT